MGCFRVDTLVQCHLRLLFFMYVGMQIISTSIIAGNSTDTLVLGQPFRPMFCSNARSTLFSRSRRAAKNSGAR